MQAVEISKPGGPDVLRLVERPVPLPGKGEVQIAVFAAGINGADLAQRRGAYPPPPGASDIPGLEVSGIVSALGEGVTGFALGDRVCALLAGGGYAETCAVPAEQVLRLPDAIEMVEAGGLIETVATVWANVFELGGLKPGETLLVHGGASGIGTTAIQLAKAFGAKVYVTVGSDEKAEACVALGADRAINYHASNFSSLIRETEQGVDVILDIIGGPYLDGNLRVLKRGGRLVFIAFAGGRSATLDIARIMMNGLTVTGSTLRARPVAEKARLLSAVENHVWPLIESGAFRPVIDSVWPLSKIADAHRHMEASRHIGKLVLGIAESVRL